MFIVCVCWGRGGGRGVWVGGGKDKSVTFSIKLAKTTKFKSNCVYIVLKKYYYSSILNINKREFIVK